jgi:hypothetical protein
MKSSDAIKRAENCIGFAWIIDEGYKSLFSANNAKAGTRCLTTGHA